MLVNCNACQKKFTVPDAAITEGGRLLQCGSCGNKWTQYPIEPKLAEVVKKKTSGSIKQPTKKKTTKAKAKKKKREINLYSEEYLKKKHGLAIKDPSDVKKIQTDKNKSKKISNGFFINFLLIIITLVTLFGILNLSRDTIINNYPFSEIYINSLYENLEIIKIIIFNIIN